MNACDIVVSGDSLGMHMAIGLKKWVVAWFGPTCHQEIDLYDRGAKFLLRFHVVLVGKDLVIGIQCVMRLFPWRNLSSQQKKEFSG